jgi:hypothetical protein
VCQPWPAVHQAVPESCNLWELVVLRYHRSSLAVISAPRPNPAGCCVDVGGRGAPMEVGCGEPDSGPPEPKASLLPSSAANPTVGGAGVVRMVSKPAGCNAPAAGARAGLEPNSESRPKPPAEPPAGRIGCLLQWARRGNLGVFKRARDEANHQLHQPIWINQLSQSTTCCKPASHGLQCSC